ncbi:MULTISPECIES: maltoporin [unclassified Janthinobacterium]|uniref:maltoporin n=1 Tax=unclassified Janthinobacterium TaxID=2610881 RepID=UPI000349E852|nr:MULTISPECIES: carbohydrate porin [unclassified Janthinobacterium]MEC5162659.1 maltoporin [Janthinobacterium sp. CG_S6]
MNRTMLKALPAAITLALACGAAVADEEGFHGYFRVGAGSTTAGDGGPQGCFGLGGNTMKYRLGNECDAYFEGGYTKEIAKSGGVSYVATVWANVYSPNSDFGDKKLGLNKAFIEAKGLDFLNGGTAWMGKRFYYRPDIHMLDLQYINMNGTGAGLDRIGAGPGKFSYAFFKDRDTNTLDANGKVVGTPSAIRQNFIYGDVPVNTDGTFDIAATIITAEGKNDDALGQKHNGWQVSLFHKQAKVFGGANTFGVQYGVGPGTGIGVGNGQMGASGYTSLGSDVKRVRVFNDLWIQPTENMGMEMVALVQKDKSDAGGSSTWTSLGVRPVYAFNQNLKMVVELGTDRVTDSNSPTKRLTKLTLAPTISAGPGLWSRPELRAFVTYGKWNQAATASVNASNNSGPIYNNGTSGTSFGVQVESWF